MCDNLCGICGDEAKTYNFDAIACNSCKEFFRRHAVKKEDEVKLRRFIK